ncbi:restriction endonuclease subunit S (plasmid) [Acinetobacter johnsonii]|jgi:type I restriction enzyme S subunit|nr:MULTISPECIES: restriction endonuclease subunit S [Acinetobacter]MCU4383021.1 restriction endonuclease subunit S [Acinetobacter ursingii]MWC20155.1 restriction endonuclease subunit S [Acinetobacter johnsonii]QSE47588.1 restriction endonuclease subunit S [Acinetobacter johnsonii]QYA57113.1 restriction endonuclease subunit S [Acinetobacter johnsonii]RSO79486.1 restriction endonuclease subunit S [Acinetobacter ursingii]
MSEWQTVAIGEICDLVTSGGTPLTSQKEYYHNGSIPWVKTKEVNQCRLYGTENHITQLGLDNSSAKLIPENSIIIAMYGDGKTAGRVALNKVPVTTNQACCNLILNKQKANYDFVFYNLMGRYDELVSKKTGSGQQNLNGKIIKEIEIDLPSLPEQKAIASVLSSLDDKIDLLHRQNKTLEAMAETLFRQWFIEEAKEDWDEVTVSSLFEVRDGTHDSPKQSPIGYPLVTSKHIGDGVLDFDSCYLISSDDYDKVNARSKVETGDILLSMIGTLGRTYLECDEVNYAIKNIGLFKTSQNPVWKYFIYLWLNSVQGKQFVDEHKSGSTQEYLSLGSLRGIQLKSPPNDLLLIFNAKVDNWFKKIHANTKQIQTLENLRDTLLPKLMSGEVRVQYQTEQVA